MRAMFFPYEKRNPYQRCLGQALAGYGVRVEAGRVRSWIPLRDVGWQGREVDVIHLHWLQSMLTGRTRMRTIWKGTLFVLHMLWLRSRGLKLVWTAHNLKPHEPRFPGLERLFRRRVARLCHTVFVHCEAARDAVGQQLGVWDEKKLVTIRHGHYIGAYENQVEREDARRKLDIDERCPIVLYLGAIRRYKGLKGLVNAFQSLGEIEAQLVIAGGVTDVDLARQLREQADDDPKIRLDTGFIAEDDVQTYMNAADVGVFPYDEILTSGAIVLAMSFGLPCIAPRLGCVEEYLDEDGGFFYEARDVGDLARALERALASRSRLTAMGRHNRAKAATWAWEDVARVTAECYRR